MKFSLEVTAEGLLLLIYNGYYVVTDLEGGTGA